MYMTVSVAVVGGYGVGMTMQSSRLPGPGETLLAGPLDLGPGGKGSNQAVGLARLGARASLLSAIGEDVFGTWGRELWQAEGVRAGHVVTTSEPTMGAFILVDDHGENSILVAPGALSALAASDVEPFAETIRTSDVCLVSLELPVEVAVEALRTARAAGVTTILNPAPAVALPHRIWQYVDIVVPNQTEAQAILGRAACGTEAAASLAALTGASVVLTMGGEGAAIVTEGFTARVPATSVPQVTDTTGAGDSFSAALAFAVGSGADLTVAARFAAAAGAYCVQRPGVIPALPYRADLPDLPDQR